MDSSERSEQGFHVARDMVLGPCPLSDANLVRSETEVCRRTLIPPEGFLREKDWKMILRSMPIPCVDIIVEKNAKVLLGFRTIRP
jgi:hypothetical protein